MKSQEKPAPVAPAARSEDELQARVEEFSRAFQEKLDLAREEGKFYYNGAWLSKEAVLAREKARKRAQWSLLVDLLMVDTLLALCILGAYKVTVVFLIPG